MRRDFKKYLESIDLGTVLIDRVEVVYKSCLEIFNKEFHDIFISETLKVDNIREYESLWLFSDENVTEAKRFLVNDEYDLSPIKNKVIHWKIDKQNYDFKETTEKSRLSLEFTLDNLKTGVLKASKENCDHLKNIILRHIWPNLKA